MRDTFCTVSIFRVILVNPGYHNCSNSSGITWSCPNNSYADLRLSCNCLHRIPFITIQPVADKM